MVDLPADRNGSAVLVKNSLNKTRRFVGLLALLCWLATPWLWWQSQRAAPRLTALRNVGGGQGNFTSDARFYISREGRRTCVFDVLQGKRIADWAAADGHGVYPGGVRSTADGRCLVAIHVDKAIEIRDAVSGKTVGTIPSGAQPAIGVYLGPDGTRAATVHSSDCMLWDIGSGERIDLFDYAPAQIRSVSFSPDGMRLAVVAGGDVRVIDLESFKTAVLPTTLVGVSMVSFAPDGRLIGYGTVGPTQLALWDLTNNRRLVQAPLASCGFLGDGAYFGVNHYPQRALMDFAQRQGWSRLTQWLADVRRERLLYDTRDGRVVASIPQGVSAVTPDGKTLATYSYDDDSILLWDVPPARVVSKWLVWITLAITVMLTVWWRRLCRSSAPTTADNVDTGAMTGPTA